MAKQNAPATETKEVAGTVPAPKVSKCEITRDEFAELASSFLVTFENDKIEPTSKQTLADPKNFSTGSFGWSAMDKLTFKLGGKNVKVQVSLNMTVVGSKDAE